MRIWLLVAVLALGCGGGRSDGVPVELVRVWRTDAPAYRDRSFELRPDWVIFGTGRYTSAMYPIEHVETIPSKKSTLVVIGYRVEDGEVLELRLEWTPGNPDRLRLGHRDQVWVPEAHAHRLKENTS